MANVTEGILFGMGNPLLDMSCTVTEEFLTKYGLKRDDAILAEESHLSIYDEIAEKFKVENIPGGATQNSIKVAQWLLQKPQATTFTGCIANDKFGRTLNDACSEVGVRTIYDYNQGKEPTGTCAVLITSPYRSLVTNLASANCFQLTHLEKPETWELVEKAKFYYSAGFFLTVSTESLLKICQHSSQNKKTMCVNLSAPFLCQFFKDQMLKVLPFVDYVFGNETEAAAFAKENNLGTEDIKEIALKIAALEYHDASRSRTVVITQGPDAVVVAQAGNVTEFPVAPLPAEKLVDTNGAGDAFVGGFLAQLVQGKDLQDCVRCGNYAAHVIIQRSGCTFPDTPDYQ